MLVLVDTPTRNRAGCIDGLRIIGPNADTLLTDYRAWPENNFPRPHSSPPLFFSLSLSPSLLLFFFFPPSCDEVRLDFSPPFYSLFSRSRSIRASISWRELSHPEAWKKIRGRITFFFFFLLLFLFLALFLSGPGICFSPLLDFRNIERAGRHSSRHELQVRLDSRSSSGTSGIYVGRCCFQCRISKSNVIRIGVRITMVYRVKCEREKETAFCLFFVFISFFSLDSTCLWSCSEINSRNKVSNFAMAPI